MRSALLLSLVTAALLGLLGLTRGGLRRPADRRTDLASRDDDPYLFVG